MPQAKAKAQDGEQTTKLPGKLVKKVRTVKRRISRLFHHEHHHVTLSSALVEIVGDCVLPPLTIPASPRSGYSKDTFADSHHHIQHLHLHRSSSSSSYSSSVSHKQHMSSPPSEPSALPPTSVSLEPSTSPPSEPMFSSPPTNYVEPNVPDPFLIDDEDDPVSDEDGSATPDEAVSTSQQTISPSHEIPLTIPVSPLSPVPPLPSPDATTAAPPSSSSESSDQEEEVPELYLPGLIIPTMFLPIPNTDPLTTLLTKYIYPPELRPTRDLIGEWQRSEFHTLVMTNSWRALAKMARDRLVAADPEDLPMILGLWYLRLSSLARLRLFNQTSAECTNLFIVLNAIEPLEARTWVFERILPFELEVMQARLKYWAGDHMGYLDALNVLLNKCRSKARLAKTDTTTVAMWKERGARVCLIIASQLVEMKDFAAATKLLEPLCKQKDGSTSPALRSSIARIYLQSGNVPMALKHINAVAADSTAEESLKDMNSALVASAEGDWAKASEILQKVLESDADNFAAVNNLSVALLSQGKLKEGIDVLEKTLTSSPSSVVVAEPFLFNLSTLYELRSATAVERKRNLLIEVAKWSGDGLKTTCLKMPTN